PITGVHADANACNRRTLSNVLLGCIHQTCPDTLPPKRWQDIEIRDFRDIFLSERWIIRLPTNRYVSGEGVDHKGNKHRSLSRFLFCKIPFVLRSWFVP